MRIFWWLWDGLRQLVGLVLPIFAGAKDFATTSPVVRWTLRAVVLLVILGLLAALQYFIPGLPTATGRYWWLQYSWLPILFLLLCAAVWLFRWLWLVWMTEEDSSDFPDIDEAWAEATAALAEAGIDLQGVPLYLVLGRPAGGEEALFQGAGIPFTVKHAPPRGTAPLHVWANKHDGIFVTCAGASRLGPLAGVLALTAELLPAGLPEAGGDLPDDDQGNATIGAGQNKLKQVQRLAQVLDAARRKGRGPSQMTEDEQRQLRMLEHADKPEEAARHTARLEHLCRLIVRDRRPECPANGILVLVPCAALYGDEDAEKTAADCKYDLQAAWNTFQMHCPMLALVCDLETAPGFPEFIDGYLAHCRSEEERRKERKRRLGRRFGWGADADPKRRLAALETDAGWIGQGMFPIQLHQNLLRPERPDRERPEDAMRRNGRLYRFLSLMRDGERRLRRVVTQGLESRTDGPALLGGCYLAATGAEPAFVAGVFQRLLEAQAYVSWTDQAVAEDAVYHRWTTYGYAALPLFVAGAAGLLWYWKSGW